MIRSSGRPTTSRQTRRAPRRRVDGDEQTVRRQAEVLGHQLPGAGDRVLLEVVAEREVAEHLEERVVPRGLARPRRGRCACRRAHALLRVAARLIVAALEARGEQVLELVHARVGEHQRRVVLRHQRRRGHDALWSASAKQSRFSRGCHSGRTVWSVQLGGPRCRPPRRCVGCMTVSAVLGAVHDAVTARRGVWWLRTRNSVDPSESTRILI